MPIISSTSEFLFKNNILNFFINVSFFSSLIKQFFNELKIISPFFILLKIFSLFCNDCIIYFGLILFFD